MTRLVAAFARLAFASSGPLRQLFLGGNAVDAAALAPLVEARSRFRIELAS